MMIRILEAALKNNGHCTIGGEDMPRIGTPLTGPSHQAQSLAQLTAPVVKDREKSEEGITLY